jgi:hypothetical protein
MPRGDVLWQRLESARPQELWKLGEIVGLADCQGRSHDVLVEQLSHFIRSAAGHSLLNFSREPHGFPYKQMLIDVADKMAPGWTFLSWTKYKLNDHHSETDVEETIWQFYEDQVRKLAAKIPEKDKAELRKQVEEDLRKEGNDNAVIAGLGSSLMGGMAGIAVPQTLAYSALANTHSGLSYLRHIRKLREYEAGLGQPRAS